MGGLYSQIEQVPVGFHLINVVCANGTEPDNRVIEPTGYLLRISDSLESEWFIIILHNLHCFIQNNHSFFFFPWRATNTGEYKNYRQHQNVPAI